MSRPFEFVQARPVSISRKKLIAEQRLFTMAAVDSNLPVDALEVIIHAFPRSFSHHFIAIDGDYLARLTRGSR